jgi:hypothetical protein
MSNVRSRPIRPGMDAPLPREWLDTIAPAIRILFGLVFIAWSWVSTVLILGRLLRPVASEVAIEGVPDRFVVAFGVALLVSVAEFVASDRWPKAYWFVLLLGDASFTAWQTRTWLVLIIGAQTEIGLLGHIAIWLASGMGGIIAAKFGEVLLFGTRRAR